jgi:DEAD/DEAH box helicase domain-containing protein
VEPFTEWVRDRPYYDGQIAATRTEPGREAVHADVDVEPRLASALADRGVERPYRHQARAIEAVRAGDDVVLATPTASGKSLAYTVPAFERAMDHGGRTLYLGPQNALVNDQAETLSALARGLGFGSRVQVERYTGSTPDDERAAIRERRPTVLLSNPDMLHYGILPHAHRIWEWFFRGLELVVVDEVHEYRGVFGSHVGLVLRRLARVCERFDAAPQFVCCSATVGNPREHAATVTGRPADGFELVTGDDSPAGPTEWVFWNPPETGGGQGRRRSSHVETTDLLVDLVDRGHQTVAFAGARQVAERYADETTERLRGRGRDDLADAVAAYQAALTDDRRAALEERLHDGDLRGVWSTSALELGVDVGGLDAVLLDGYPGTRMATRQRAGRAGRGSDRSLVVVVAGEDQLDQHLMTSPGDFFEADPERAVADPRNEAVLPGHVRSAARENWLAPDDERFFGERYPGVVTDLTDAGELARRETGEGVRWTFDGDGSPQHDQSLRSASEREVTLFDRASGDRVGALSFGDALRDAHPGAVYHHQGTTYEVTDLDLRRDRAELARTRADFYTRVLHDKTITVEADLAERDLPRADVTLRFAAVTMRKQITGFERRDRETGETLSRQPLDLPETSLSTRGLYFTVADPVERAVRDRADAAFDGGIHAAEHALISLFPTEVLCDRRDVGGLSTPHHPHTDTATVFVYDGHPGGVGLAREGYGRLAALAERASDLVDACDCTGGCPACVQSPHCGNANAPLDPAGAVAVLDMLRGAWADRPGRQEDGADGPET